MRKTVQVYPAVKIDLNDLKKHLQLSNDSEVVSYLINLYSLRESKLLKHEHDELLKQVENHHRQGVL